MPGDVPGMGGASTPADADYGDNISLAGTLGGKGDFDRRKKKRCAFNFWDIYIFKSLQFQIAKDARHSMKRFQKLTN